MLRAYVAPGYKINNAASAEIGYMNQITKQCNRKVFERNHTL
jgi:hypothetical protein